MGYRPDIDGLRAVAVLSVLFYHAHLGLPGGFVGVDIFFVISGFLITGLLYRSISAGTFSYLDFWERRVRRLAPALTALTVFVALSAPLVLLPEDLKDLGGNLVCQPLLLANVYFWRVVQGGYFGDAPEIRPLLHTWSLGVEEQFYLFFPMVLMLFSRLVPHRVGAVLLALFFGSAALSIVLTPVRQSFSFFNLPTRAWELLLGGLLVFLLRGTGRRSLDVRMVRELLAWTGVALLGWPVLFYHAEMPFPGDAAMVPCLGTALLILANSSERMTWVGRRLAHPVMVRIGQISYSLYLWHWPLIAYTEYLGLLTTQTARISVFVLSFLAGYASWLWIETPIRERRWLPQRQAMVGLFLAYAAFAIGTGSLYLLKGGLPKNWPEPVRAQEYRSRVCWVDPMSNEAKAFPLGSEEAVPCRFLLWGDSHAMSLAPLLHRLGEDYRVRGLQLTATSTAPLFSWGHEVAQWDKSPKYKAHWRELARRTIQENGIRTVFLSAYWSSYGRPDFADDLASTVAQLHDHGIRVVFVCDFPRQPRVNTRNLRLVSRWSLLDPEPVAESEHHARNAKVYDALARIPQCADFVVLDPAEIVLDWSSLTKENHPLYIDSHHLSDEGTMLLRPLFEPVFWTMKQ